MEVKATNTNMYCNIPENIFSNMQEEGDSAYYEMYEEEIPLYDYEEEDAFSEVDYDSDACEASLSKRRPLDEEFDSEDEFWEEDDEEISNAIRLQLLREKSKKQLQGLSVLEGKLNWLEKVPVVESDLDNDDYPVLGAIVKPAPHNNNKLTSPYMPWMIEVRVGNRTYIEFERVICNSVKEGKTCAYGDKCKFSHAQVKPKTDHSTKLCNFIRNGEECKFEGRCKFSHDVKILKRNQPGDKKTAEQKAKSAKPMCRNGAKCENRKCTFTHPTGHKKTQREPAQATKVRTPNASPRQAVADKKFLLCKNLFKVEGGAINVSGTCRFGDECKFAHSRTEVEKKIKDNLSDFECKHKHCQGVEVEFITKKDKDGKERKTRRYKNSATRKCFKIHEKERVTDFIVRTQNATA